MAIIMDEPRTAGALTDQEALLRLMAWLSPAFPVGSFAYSGGLERAVADRLVFDAASLRSWIYTSMEMGTARTDGLLLAMAHQRHAHDAELASLSELAAALAGSRERYEESLGLGQSFLIAVKAWPEALLDRLPAVVAYPVAVGAVSGVHGVPVEWAILAFMQAYVAQAGSVAIRLGIIGQVQAVAIQSEAEALLRRVAGELSVAGEEDLGSGTVMMDISSLRHEIQPVRLFRS